MSLYRLGKHRRSLYPPCFVLAPQAATRPPLSSPRQPPQSPNYNAPNRASTAWTYSNIIAGSDSTSVVLRCVWYNLLAHPTTLDRLHAELLAADQNHAITRPFPKWNEVRELPYLDACINEAVRLHPPFCLPFERVVPDAGIEICGHFLEGGTIVGMSPYVINRHRGTFGEDADYWRPERWLGLPEEAHKKMVQSLLTVSFRWV